MSKVIKNNWKAYRNRNCYYKGKKIKLRKYIYIMANVMRFENKPGFKNVDHLQNYKAALSLYGFGGIKIYEDYFFKGIPLPEDRSFWVKIGLKLAPLYVKIQEFFDGVKSFLRFKK